MRDTARRIGSLAALAVAAAAQVGLLTVLAGRVPPGVLALSAAAASFIASLATLRGGMRLREMGVRSVALAAVAGVLGLFAAPYLVAANRMTDAPSGSELIFFAAVLWGGMAMAWAAGAMAIDRRPMRAFAICAGGLAAVTGAAGVLANWERPSSFSPFVRYVAQEWWMLVAGVCFVGAIAIVTRLARAGGGPRPLAVAGAAGTVCALAAYALVPAAAGLAPLGEQGATLALWAIAWAVTWMLACSVTRQGGPAIAGVTFAAAPAALTLLSFLERAVGVSGPDPVVWFGAAGGALLTAAGVTAVLAAGWRRDTHQDVVPGAIARSQLALAACAAAAVIVALTWPSIGVTVEAHRQARDVVVAWDLGGWETVAGWAAVAAVALVVAAAVDRRRRTALAAFAAAAAYPLLASTPYRTLTSGLSSDVQQDFGTEYASIVFRALPAWPTWAIVAGCALTAAWLAFSAFRPGNHPGRVKDRKGPST